MFTVVCSTTGAAEQVRDVLRRHGLRMDLVDDRSYPEDPNTYLTINYKLDAQAEAQIRAALGRISGVTVTS
jgi:hypothetical protein